jgi:hypothetical protein
LNQELPKPFKESSYLRNTLPVYCLQTLILSDFLKKSYIAARTNPERSEMVKWM